MIFKNINVKEEVEKRLKNNSELKKEYNNVDKQYEHKKSKILNKKQK